MRLGATLLAGLSALGLCACGTTLQDQQISHGVLEGLIASPFPVYWLGARFQGLSITEESHDPGGAYTVQYGDCLQGGQGACVPPLRVVTSPDNSFVPGGSTPRRRVAIRGVASVVAASGQTIAIPTAGVVVNIYARSAQLAMAAARTAVAINRVGAPEAPLPAPLPDTGFARKPLPTQVPPPLRPLR